MVQGRIGHRGGTTNPAGSQHNSERPAEPGESGKAPSAAHGMLLFLDGAEPASAARPGLRLLHYAGPGGPAQHPRPAGNPTARARQPAAPIAVPRARADRNPKSPK